MSSSIWSSVEADAWSRDFEYEDYVFLHHKSGCTGRVLSREALNQLYHALETQLEIDIGV